MNAVKVFVNVILIACAYIFTPLVDLSSNKLARCLVTVLTYDNTVKKSSLIFYRKHCSTSKRALENKSNKILKKSTIIFSLYTEKWQDMYYVFVQLMH